MRIAICKRCQIKQLCDPHHVYGVENNRDEIIDLCRKCHTYITSHPKYAYENGYSKRMDGEYRRKPRKKRVLKKALGIDNFK